MFDQIMCKKGHKNVYYKYAYNEQKVAEESLHTAINIMKIV